MVFIEKKSIQYKFCVICDITKANFIFYYCILKVRELSKTLMPSITICITEHPTP